MSCNGQPVAVPDSIGLPVQDFTRRQIVLGLQDYARRCGFSKVVVGSSGGIDSTLTLALAAEAIGAENVFAITMPSAYSSESSVSDSVALCNNLRIKLFTHPIRGLVEQYGQGFAAAFDTPLPSFACVHALSAAAGKCRSPPNTEKPRRKSHHASFCKC